MGNGEAKDLKENDVALAHWHVNDWGGAEYLVTKMAEVLDIDRVYTTGKPSPEEPNPYGDVSFYDVTKDLTHTPVRRLQSHVGRVFEYSLWEDVDWRKYGHPNVLITSGATTRAVITPDDTLHANYCHSPPRWFYDLYHDRKDSLIGHLARPVLRYLRMRDMTVDPRVDHYFANSPIISRRLWKYYGRESEVLYPPIDLTKYFDDGDERFYLHLGRLDKEKGVEEVIEVFESLDEKIIFAGGRGDIEESVFKRISQARNMHYEGFVPEERKLELLATCTAVIFNGRNEDFGIVPIEANASGKPVLARNEGFPGIFVENGKNGYLHDGTVAGIKNTIQTVQRNKIDFNPRNVVGPYSLETFQEKIQNWVNEWEDGLNRVTMS